jgi:FkbM family methyltransferase
MFNKINWILAKEVGYAKFLQRYTIRQLSKRILRIDNHLKLKNGLTLKLPKNSRFGTELFVKREGVDWGSEDYLIKFLDQDKTFLDVGANIGYYSLLLAPYCHQVYAFEPDLRSLPALRINAQQAQNITVVEQAVFSQVGEMEMDFTGEPETSRLLTKNRVKTVKQKLIKVAVNTLDNFAAEHPEMRVTAIKTDVEGADFDVLLGAKALIERDQPLLLSEIYPTIKLIEFLKLLNYSIFALVKPRSISEINAPPRWVEITQKTDEYRYKMLFLVPQRLREAFLTLSIN